MALLELKKGGEPCNGRELVINIIFVVFSLRGNPDIPYVKSHLLFFSIKTRQLLWYESLEFKLVRLLHIHINY